MFREIPTNFHQNLQKNCKLHRKNEKRNEISFQSSKISDEYFADFLYLSDAKYKHLVDLMLDLENAEKCAYSRYRSCPHSRERAAENLHYFISSFQFTP